MGTEHVFKEWFGFPGDDKNLQQRARISRHMKKQNKRKKRQKNLKTGKKVISQVQLEYE